LRTMATGFPNRTFAIQPSFSGNGQAKNARDKRALENLFREIPKTELHCHLSGSTPRSLIREFMAENGIPAEQIQQQSRLKRHYKSLDDFLETYYRVASAVNTPAQFRKAAAAIVQQAGCENVRYLELRSSILAKNGATPEVLVNAIETGIAEGQTQVLTKTGHTIQVALIALAQRGGSTEQSMESARWAVQLSQKLGSLIRGFDLAGSEGKHSVNKHAEALRYVKAHGLPLTVHAGETEDSEGISGTESIQAALDLGADRLGHGLQSMKNPKLLEQLAKAQTPIEVCPWSNVQLKNVKDYASHPLPQMLAAGLNVSLSTDNRMISQITLRQQWMQLYRHGLLPCWEQVKTLTLNGIRGAFLSPLEKLRLQRDIQTEFAAIETKYRTLINRLFCKPCVHPRSLFLQESA
jgi:adenosine deaminase